jgi:hypothetical protein
MEERDVPTEDLSQIRVTALLAQYREASAHHLLSNTLIWQLPAVTITVSGILVAAMFAYDVPNIARALAALAGALFVFAMTVAVERSRMLQPQRRKNMAEIEQRLAPLGISQLPWAAAQVVQMSTQASSTRVLCCVSSRRIQPAACAHVWDDRSHDVARRGRPLGRIRRRARLPVVASAQLTNRPQLALLDRQIAREILNWMIESSLECRLGTIATSNSPANDSPAVSTRAVTSASRPSASGGDAVAALEHSVDGDNGEAGRARATFPLDPLGRLRSEGAAFDRQRPRRSTRPRGTAALHGTCRWRPARLGRRQHGGRGSS